MYKTKLQELCHQETWAVPDYTVSRDGPEHNPRFRASVTVNGVNFDAVDFSRTAKEAQNKAAQAAVDHFAFSLPPKPSPRPPAILENLSYKSQLQIYAQRYLIDLPNYTHVCEGSKHAPRFKAKATVNGRTFNSMQFFNTLKEAENDAAKAALSFLSPPDGNTEDNTNMYKNLLQELVLKNGVLLPNYKTGSNGASHLPVFSSIVEVGGESFFGEVAKSKKQAEMNAAKVAWFKLKERFDANSGKASRSFSSSVHEHLEPVSSVSQTKFGKTFELSYINAKQSEGCSDKKQDNDTTIKNGSGSADMSSYLENHIQEDADSFKSKEVIIEYADSPNGVSTTSSLGPPSDNSILDVVSAFPMGPANSSLHCNRVRVYPRKAGIVFPKGVNVLPFSDDTWVAVSLDGPNYGDNCEENEDAVENCSIENAISVKDNRQFEVTEMISSQDETSSSSSEFDGADISILDINSESQVREVNCAVQCNKIMVYPYNSGVVLPEGAFCLPFSDDKWVAFSYV